MASVVWKFTLLHGSQDIPMPAKAEILTAQMQGENLCLWALCDPEAPYRDRRVHVCGTDHPVEDKPVRYVATVQQGLFVWHVFEEIQ